MTNAAISPNITAGIYAQIEKYFANFEEMPGVIILHDLLSLAPVYMSKRGLDMLRITSEELVKLSADEYFGRYFNQEDIYDANEQILGLLQKNNTDEMVTYFQQVRYHEQGDWNWYMASCKIFMRNDAGEPRLVITLAIPVDAMHHMTAKAERLLQENNFFRKNAKNFGTLTRREKDVLRLTALGKSAAEIAEKLFIAITTAETHRRNIKNKLSITTPFELQQYARAFDLI